MLSACVFSGKPKTEFLAESEDISLKKDTEKFVGDSITVDTVIGDFRLFYKVSEKKNMDSASMNRLEEDKRDIHRVDKEILLNIQKLDTTTVVSNKRLTKNDFCPILGNVREDDYCIDVFFLKEVNKGSIVFGIELIKLEEEKTIDMELTVSEKGEMNYILLN